MKVIIFLILLLTTIFSKIVIEPIIGYNYDIVLNRDDNYWKATTMGILIDYNKYKLSTDFVSNTRYGFNDRLIEGLISIPIKNKVWVTAQGAYGLDSVIVFSQEYSYYLNVNTKIYKGFLTSIQYDQKKYTSVNISTFSINPILYHSYFRYSYKFTVNKLANDEQLSIGHLLNFNYYINDDDNLGLWIGYNPEFEKDINSPKDDFVRTDVFDIGLKGQKKFYDFFIMPMAGYTIGNNKNGIAYKKLNLGMFLKYKFQI